MLLPSTKRKAERYQEQGQREREGGRHSLPLNPSFGSSSLSIRPICQRRQQMPVKFLAISF